MTIVAIDPGPEQSAFVLYNANDSARPLVGSSWKEQSFGILPNAEIVDMLATKAKHGNAHSLHLAIEMVASYGMPVGREVFDTCVWIGRFIQAWAQWGAPFTRVYRSDVKTFVCHDSRAKDGNIRAALIDLFGPGKDKAIGTKKAPGPLYGVSSDVWAALAVAVTFAGGGARREAKLAQEAA